MAQYTFQNLTEAEGTKSVFVKTSAGCYRRMIPKRWMSLSSKTAPHMYNLSLGIDEWMIAHPSADHFLAGANVLQLLAYNVKLRREVLLHAGLPVLGHVSVQVKRTSVHMAPPSGGGVGAGLLLA